MAGLLSDLALWRGCLKIPSRLESILEKQLSMRRRQLPIAPGLLVSLGGLILFAGITIAVGPDLSGSNLPRNNVVTEIDQDINESLHKINQESPAGVVIFNDITTFGSSFWIKRIAAVVALAFVVISVGLVILRRRSITLPLRCTILVLAWMLVMSLGELLNVELKEFVKRARPPYHEAAHTSGYSFPSGHSMAAFIAYGMLAYILVRLIPHRRSRQAVAGALATLVLLVGFSRMFLGAHWLSDVVGGFAAGACWLGLCITAIEIIPGTSRAASRAASAAEVIVQQAPEPAALIPEPILPDKTL
jgi:undecaprenyl-diphosphatase